MKNEQQTRRLEKMSSFFKGENFSRLNFYKKLLLTAFAVVFALGASAQTIKEWKYDSDRDLKSDRIQFFFSKGMDFTHKLSSKVKTPDGQNTLELQIESVSPNALAFFRQVSFIIKTPLQTVAKYRIEFWCKGSVDGKVAFNASQSGAPYKRLAKKAWKEINITNQWQKVTLEFMPVKNWNCKIAVPRFMLGKYPVGGKIYLGPVLFKKVEKYVPLALNSQWHVQAGLKETPPINSFKVIPAELPGINGKVKAISASPIDNVIDISSLGYNPKEKTVALLFNEFNSPESGTMQMGFSAEFKIIRSGDYSFFGQTAYF